MDTRSPYALLFHGTAHGFAQFRLSDNAREANNALGVHLAESELAARTYAQCACADAGAASPRVLLCLAEIASPWICEIAEAFFSLGGADRARLLRGGFDGIITEPVIDDSVWVALRPQAVVILGGYALGHGDALAIDEPESGGWLADIDPVGVIRRIAARQDFAWRPGGEQRLAQALAPRARRVAQTPSPSPSP
ncbi:hypothetical protein J2T57_001556 [Natronocella acetinitrilica]|uniref:Uncharacterized protein n=1 Tax=Natronocella acetinitrilica TaxID=414046 RepID=A0AAE3G2J0_9GAMM|nr:hypothetical protein [Natronocella acetinitrilica]MCP1674454.1 hypothetical protein [Natronocella acetinitrilica]